MIAEILSVGTELLLGEVTDTNARFLSSELSQMGIDLYYRATAGDNYARLLETIQRALSRSDLVLISGGLGPTMDDITRECAAEAMGLSLTLHEESAEAIRERYRVTNRPMPENVLKQAMLPENAAVFPNTCGTAPGCAMEKDGKVILTLPGPPREMETMFRLSAKPYLMRFSGAPIFSKVLRTFGIGEPALEDKIRDLLLLSDPTVGLYVGFGEVRIRISAKAADEEKAMEKIAPVAAELRDRLGNAVYAEGDCSMEQAVADLLMRTKTTVATAESCTGGMIAAALVSVPGISDCLMEGHVTYSNEAKHRILGVSNDTLAVCGAVSHETAREMAAGLQKMADVDIAVSVTGIAGPGGGTPQKPVGLVYIGLADRDSVRSYEFHFDGERDRVRRLSMLNALNLVRLHLLNE